MVDVTFSLAIENGRKHVFMDTLFFVLYHVPNMLPRIELLIHFHNENIEV